MLSKSNNLGFSAFSMNHHYLELQVFLTEVEKDPSVALNCARHVFFFYQNPDSMEVIRRPMITLERDVSTSI